MGRKPAHWTRVDRHYEALRVNAQTLFRRPRHRHVLGCGMDNFLSIRIPRGPTGSGEQDATGTLGFVENNSGSQIGRGFQNVRHLFGGLTDRPGLESQPAPARVLYVVAENGDLRCFRYSGSGEQDPTGTLGFEGPDQGKQIGNGF